MCPHPECGTQSLTFISFFLLFILCPFAPPSLSPSLSPSLLQVPFYDIDLTKDPTTSGLDNLFSKYSFHSVINFAGMKAVGESMKIPLEYYSCNLSIVFNLLAIMKKYRVKNFVFSSTACVYGEPQYLPIHRSGVTSHFFEVACTARYTWSVTPTGWQKER